MCVCGGRRVFVGVRRYRCVCGSVSLGVFRGGIGVCLWKCVGRCMCVYGSVRVGMHLRECEGRCVFVGVCL